MKKFVLTIILAVFFASCVGGAYFWLVKLPTIGEEAVQPETTISNAHAENMMSILEGDSTEDTLVTTISKRILPALVSVNMTGVEYVSDFWGFGTYEQEVQGNASGIIVAQNDDELLIVTNYHVVEDSTALSVTFVDGTEAEATVKGTEENEDLAVISVKLNKISDDTKNVIRLAVLGDSDELKVGSFVVAIGNALGYGQATTVGIVSALNREVDFEGKTLTLIQTDAAINPGNSGGALINRYGEVIGINNSKISSTKVEGICYAIPISKAIPIIENLMNRETLSKSEQAYIGITGQIVSESYSQSFNIPRGVYVTEVKGDSPAEKAGVVAGMIITKINGYTVNSEESYENVLSFTRGGSSGTLTVSYKKNGKYIEETLEIVFGYRG